MRYAQHDCGCTYCEACAAEWLMLREIEQRARDVQDAPLCHGTPDEMIQALGALFAVLDNPTRGEKLPAQPSTRARKYPTRISAARNVGLRRVTRTVNSSLTELFAAPTRTARCCTMMTICAATRAATR